MARFSRGKYYIDRMREAGVGSSLRTIQSRVWPYVLAPLYLLPGRRPLPSDTLRRLQELGDSISLSLIESARSDGLRIAQIERRASQALSGYVQVLGFGEAQIPRGAGWSCDPFHNYCWTDQYFPRVDFIAAHARCDVKIPWELSRLQYLVWLAEGALLLPKLRDDCVRCFCSIVEDWIKSNRAGFGVNWTCAMEVSIRAVNLALATAVIGKYLARSKLILIAQSLAEHYVFLRRFPEISDVTGNHYLADLLGELVLSTLVGSTKAHIRSIYAFTAEADRQFDHYGCHIENALIYHRLCTDMVALASAFAARSLGAVPERLQGVLSRAIGFALTVADAAYILPVMGDCDSGQILDFGSSARNVSALAALSADYEAIIPELTVWLYAIAGSRRSLRVDLAKPEIAAHRSAFLLIRHSSATTIMRVGAQGLNGRAPHDHDDAQSIWIRLKDADLIVDEGCHSYTLDAKIRYSNISSRGHNVLQPIGRPRFQGAEGSITRSMRGAPLCAVAGVCVVDGVPQMVASLDVADRIDACCRFLKMKVTGNEFTVVVEDTWSGREPLVLPWHFGPGIFPQLSSDRCLEFTHSKALRRVEFESDWLDRLEIFEFDFSDAYGKAETCSGVRVYLKKSSQGKLISRFLADI